MVNEQREFINNIRDDCQASERVKDSLNNSIQTLAKDLYSKDTHFIFELIQNAEDNEYGTSKPSLSFKLTQTDPTDTQGADGALIIQNNERGFSRENVDAICTVGKTTKIKRQGYIGEKGIGFKSVFRVTTTPYIFSNAYQFCLPEHDERTGLGYIVPQWIEKPPDGIDLNQTTIILPLDKADFGYDKIEKMLRDIEPEAILFLSKLKDIQIYTDTGDALTILKDDSKQPLVEIFIEGERQSEFFLHTKTFNKPEDVYQENREGIEERDVSIVFPLDGDKTSVGKIFAYLPVRSDTGLPFLINGDFILTSSREDIQSDLPWNRWLMDCIGELVADALPRLKEKGLLTLSLLEALVSGIQKLVEDSMFYPIVNAVSIVLLNEELLLANDGTFITARHAKLASSAKLRELLSYDQLKQLFQSDYEIKWLSGEITRDRTPDLHNYLTNKLNVEEITPEGFARRITKEYLTNQTDDWFVRFYVYFLDQQARDLLKTKPILRLQDNSLVVPFRSDGTPNAYLPPQEETDYPIVKRQIVSNENALEFLIQLGLSYPDSVAEVIDKVLPQYPRDNCKYDDAYILDMKKIYNAYSTDSHEKKRQLINKLKGTAFILAENPVSGQTIYKKPGELYIRNDDLLVYFDGNEYIWFVSGKYDTSFHGLFNDLGVSDSVRITCRSDNEYNELSLPYIRNYRKGLRGFDPNIEIEGLKHSLTNPTADKSLYIWNNFAIRYKHCLRGTILICSDARFSRQAKTYREESSIESPNFGTLLIDYSWLPNKIDNKYHKPSELSLDDLPEAFLRDEKLADQLGMKKNDLAKLAEKAGIPTEDIDLLRKYPEEFKRWKAQMVAQGRKPEFPTRTVTNPERRAERITEQIIGSPIKEYNSDNERSIRRTSGAIDPDTVLKELYTNKVGQMICQICEKEMPFKKRNGEYYYESVEALSRDHFPKEHVAQFLALCPLCAAMYKEFVKRNEVAMKEFKNALINSDEPEVPVQLGDLKEQVHFVESHFQDIKAVLSYYTKAVDGK